VSAPEHVISYGKAEVPVYRIGPGDTLFAVAVTVEVFGDNFLPAYTKGDNTNVVATDSMKNFVLEAARAFEGTTIEAFAHHVGAGLLRRYPQMEALGVSARELRFDRERGVLFSRHPGDHGVAWLDLRRDGRRVVVADHRCGRAGLELWKLRGSAFTSFVRDEYTTLPERGDRPLFIGLDVDWRYEEVGDAIREHPDHITSWAVREAVIEVFDGFVSESIQHLVNEIGHDLLRRFPEVSFSAQNRTRDPVGDGAFTDPFPAFGTIRLTLRR
jgi:urate oxidase / 2-oxo-4-hydroxy-4-carboxy-5-ureidoimidazoline decarboxylase